jgi:transposase
MKDMIQKSCGLDIHQAIIVACIQRQGYQKQIRSYGTTTQELELLKQWLKEEDITHIAMESTGIYWKPVYNILEDDRWELLLVNARHMKNVPGRKTDVQDCEWICKLLRAGLLKGSFIPPKDIQQLRSLTRHQKTLQHQIQNEKNRVHKLLQQCNIKITQVLSDVFGVAGMSILTDLSNGITSPEKLAKHMEKNKRIASKKEQAISCLNGKISLQEQIMLKVMLQTIAFYGEQIIRLEKEVNELIKPYQLEHGLLQTIPGIKEKAANHIIAELSVNMEHFPSEKHLSSWAGLCPGNNESAGKKKSSRLKHGNNHLRAILTECAWAAVKTNNTYFRAKFYKLSPRMGRKQALAAIAHKIIINCYHILKYKVPFKELGSDYFTKGKEEKLVQHYKKKLMNLGYSISIEPVNN